MKTAVAVCLAVVLAAGCTDSSEPSPPPEPVDSLTDDTSEQPPPDTETETATDEETEATSEPPPDDAGKTTGASGAPELPAEASEQTEAGADAFVRYYLEYFDYLRQNPHGGDLSQFAGPDCVACESFTSQIADFEQEGSAYDATSVEIVDVRTVQLGDEYLSTAELNELPVDKVSAEGDVLDTNPARDGVELIFTLEQNEGVWTIALLQLGQ